MRLQSFGRTGFIMFAPGKTIRTAAVVTAACAALLSLPTTPAQARVFVGVGIGLPFYGPYLPPPVYYPPPAAYYPPPPVYYTPPPPAYSQAPVASGPGQACYAGPYVCPMD